MSWFSLKITKLPALSELIKKNIIKKMFKLQGKTKKS